MGTSRNSDARAALGATNAVTTWRVVAIATATTATIYGWWRVSASLRGADPALGALLLLTDAWGAVLLGAWLWRARPGAGTGRVPASSPHVRADIVVTAGAASRDALERTLVALRSVQVDGSVIVIGRERSGELVGLCAAHGVRYRSDGGTTATDSFLRVIERDGRADAGSVLWLDAGQVPRPDVLAATLGWFDADPAIATVQLGERLLSPDSFASMSRTGDESSAESRAIFPALGARGVAPWAGAGSLVRRAALAELDPVRDGDPCALERLASRLHRRGWCTAHDPRPLIGVLAPDTLTEYLGYRRRRALAAFCFATSSDGPLRARSLPGASRRAALASCVGFTASLRATAMVGVLVATLLTGRLPFTASATGFALCALPYLFMATVARPSTSGGALAPGEWTRCTWRNLAGDLAAWAAALGVRPVRFVRREDRSGVRSFGRLRALAVLVVALDLALLLRASTLVRPGVLRPLSTTARVAVLGAALAALVPMIDVLQMVARRRQRRTTHRYPVDIPVRLDGIATRVRSLDLSPHGIGVMCRGPLEVGSRWDVILDLGRHNQGGATRVPATVRSSIPRDDAHRVGLSFDGVPAPARESILAFCLAAGNALHPREVRQTRPNELGTSVGATRRRWLRVLTVPSVALGGVVLLAGPSAAAPVQTTSGQVCLVDDAGTPLTGGTAQYYSNGWKPFGTTDATGCVAGELPVSSSLPVSLNHRGVTNQRSQNTTTDPTYTFTTKTITVQLNDTNGTGLPNATVQFYANGWQPLGTTNTDGTTTTQLLPTTLPISINHRGVTNQRSQNTTTDPTYTFTTKTITVQLNDTNGTGLPNATVQFYANGWQPLGTTNTDGTTTTQLLPTTLPISINHRGVTNQRSQNTTTDPTYTFTTKTITVQLNDTNGTGLPNATVQFYANGWQPLGTTNTDGTTTTQLLPTTLPISINHRGVTNQRSQNTTTDPTYTFTTGRIVADPGKTLSSYYGGSWKSASSGIELLPGSTTFGFVDGTTVVGNVVAMSTLSLPSGTSTPIVPTTSASPTSSAGTPPSTTSSSTTPPSTSPPATSTTTAPPATTTTTVAPAPSTTPPPTTTALLVVPATSTSTTSTTTTTTSTTTSTTTTSTTTSTTSTSLPASTTSGATSELAATPPAAATPGGPTRTTTPLAARPTDPGLQVAVHAEPAASEPTPASDGTVDSTGGVDAARSATPAAIPTVVMGMTIVNTTPTEIGAGAVVFHDFGPRIVVTDVDAPGWACETTTTAVSCRSTVALAPGERQVIRVVTRAAVVHDSSHLRDVLAALLAVLAGLIALRAWIRRQRRRALTASIDQVVGSLGGTR